jgi:hypothetical protein
MDDIIIEAITELMRKNDHELPKTLVKKLYEKVQNNCDFHTKITHIKNICMYLVKHESLEFIKFFYNHTNYGDRDNEFIMSLFTEYFIKYSIIYDNVDIFKYCLDHVPVFLRHSDELFETCLIDNQFEMYEYLKTKFDTKKINFTNLFVHAIDLERNDIIDLLINDNLVDIGKIEQRIENDDFNTQTRLKRKRILEDAIKRYNSMRNYELRKVIEKNSSLNYKDNKNFENMIKKFLFSRKKSKKNKKSKKKNIIASNI